MMDLGPRRRCWCWCWRGTSRSAPPGWTGCTPGSRVPAARWTPSWSGGLGRRCRSRLSGRLDPASGLLLADAAHEAREAGAADREQAESDLTRALHAAFAEPGSIEPFESDAAGRELLHELSAACLRVQLSRRFLNDVVRAARVVRRKMVVRYLRLAGHADWPATAEFDDTPPETLAEECSRKSRTVVLT